MIDCAFSDPAAQPNEAELEKALGVVGGFWFGYLAHLKETWAQVSFEWKLMKSGWVLIPNLKKRRVCYLFPANASFTAAFALGDKAVTVARDSTLPQAVKDAIEAARPYAEGRGVHLKVGVAEDFVALKTLTAIKLG